MRPQDSSSSVRSAHRTISDAGLIGDGIIPRPGEVSLAHNGLLFLDELPELPRNVLEVMRLPLEDHTITIARNVHEFSDEVHVGSGNESPPQRILQRQIARVHVYSAHDSAVRRQRFPSPSSIALTFISKCRRCCTRSFAGSSG